MIHAKCPYRLLNLLFYGLFPAFCLASEAHEIRSYSSPQYGFSLGYPTGSFEEVEIATPGVGLALRSKAPGGPAPASHFPTLTVTISARRFDRAASLATHAEEVLSNYHAIGLTSAVLKDTRGITLKPGPALQVLLSYRQAGAAYLSSVTLVPGKECTYVLTFIDNERDYAGHAAVLRQILESFQVQQPAGDSHAATSSSRTHALLIGVLLLVLLTAAAVWYVRTRPSLPPPARQ